MRHRMIRRVEALAALTTAGVLLCLLALSYFVELRGPYIDAIASDFATRRLGQQVTMLDVRVRHWREVRFGLATVTTAGARTLVACGSGRIFFSEFALLKGEYIRARVALHDVALLEELYRHWSASSWAAGKAFQDPIFVKHLSADFFEREDYSEAHLRAFKSDEMVLTGGARWTARKFLKAHVFVLLPDSRVERLPKELRARMIRRWQGWSGFRVAYAAGRITVYGHSGPFFTAQWASAS